MNHEMEIQMGPCFTERLKNYIMLMYDEIQGFQNTTCWFYFQDVK